jgi:hypothetical protein
VGVNKVKITLCVCFVSLARVWIFALWPRESAVRNALYPRVLELLHEKCLYHISSVSLSFPIHESQAQMQNFHTCVIPSCHHCMQYRSMAFSTIILFQLVNKNDKLTYMKVCISLLFYSIKRNPSEEKGGRSY